MAKVNWDATFQDFKKVKFEDIYAYCEEKGGEILAKIDKLVEQDEHFLGIKKVFYKNEFPQYIPQPKPSKPTMKEMVAASKEKRAAGK